MAAGWIALLVVLWLAVLLLLALVLGLSRRVRELSQRVGGGISEHSSEMAVGGPEVGSLIELARIGPVMPSGDVGVETTDRVVLFLNSSCGPCRSFSDMLMAEREVGVSLQGANLVVVTDEPGADHYSRLMPDELIVQRDNQVSRRLGINGTPFGLAVGSDDVVYWSGITGRVEDVREMVDALRVRSA